MKQLLFIALLCLTGYGAMAQAGSLTVTNNNTTCWVYYRIFGGPPAACNGSGGGPVISNFIALAPGATITYPAPASIPGFPGGGGNFIFGAWAYSGPMTCNPLLRRVGEPCSGLTLFNPGYTVLTAACAPCGTIANVTWTTTGTLGAPATFTFN